PLTQLRQALASERLLLLCLPAVEVGLLNEPGRLHLRREEGPHHARVKPLAPAKLHDALQQFALALRVSDRLARVPFPPRDLVQQPQPLLHETQQVVERLQGARWRGRRGRGPAAAPRQSQQQAHDTRKSASCATQAPTHAPCSPSLAARAPSP